MIDHDGDVVVVVVVTLYIQQNNCLLTIDLYVS